MKIRKAGFAALFLTICLFACTRSHAQTVTGDITGTVTDQSGAVIPNATVTALNVQTGVTHVTGTNGAGEYSIRFLQIGQYNITISAKGFKTFQSVTFTLQPNQVARINSTLVAGSAAQTVTVQGALQPLLDTQDATVSTTFSSSMISNLPLNGRNFSSVTQFIPGAVNTDPASMSNVNAIARSTNMGGEVAINGNRALNNSYFLDGVDINETISNSIAYNVAPEAIQNLTVVTTNGGAQYGNANGGEVLAVIKNGTNHFHGGAYWYLENDNLDANSWANNFSGTPKQPFTQSIFGGLIGGPILRNKLFFFADYSGARWHTGGEQVLSVIPEAFRKGDFSQLLSRGIQLRHFVPGQGLVDYPNNQVQVTNPVALFLFSHPNLYPLPNRQTPAGQLTGQNNYIGPNGSFERNDQGDIKIDYRIGSRDDLNVRWLQGEGGSGTSKVAIPGIQFPQTQSYPTKGIAINEVHTFSNSIVNEFRAGYTRVRWLQVGTEDLTGTYGSNGNQAVGINYIQPSVVQGFTEQYFQNQGAIAPGGSETYFTSLGSSGEGDTLVENNFTYGDDITFLLGRHTLHAGVQVLRYQQNNFYSGNGGILGLEAYNGQFTGSTISDFDTNMVSASNVSDFVGRNGQRQYRDAAYVQDNWQATTKLALNIGLRYEWDQPIYEVNNKEASIDVNNMTYVLAGTAAAKQAFGNARALYHGFNTDFQPRLGFAYSVNPKLVIRGGYGITSFMAGTGANLRPTFNPPFQQTFSLPATEPATNTSSGNPSTAQDALPTRFTQGTITPGEQFNILRYWHPDIKPAVVQQFSLTTQYQINNHLSATLGYVGEVGDHLTVALDDNQLTSPGAVAPFFDLVGQNGAIVGTGSDAVMNYNGMQAQLQYRTHNGLEYVVNYTYSKSLTNNPGFFGQQNVAGPSAYWQNRYDGMGDYGPAGMDVRHNLNATGVYNLPFGRGKLIGNKMNRLEDEVAGGWQVSSAIIAYSGVPVTIGAPNVANVHNNASRPNQYRHMKIEQRSISHWFGTGADVKPCASGVDDGVCAYGIPAQNNFGDAAVGTERAPGYAGIDFTAGKNFKIVENQTLGFKADFFNIFNIASYDNPDNGITDANFGQITSQRGLPRMVQLSLHYNF